MIPASHQSFAPEWATLRVVALPGEVAGIRSDVSRLGRRAGLDDDRLADVVLAVGEACANAVIHAYVGREPGPLTVRTGLTDAGLEVTVSDAGRGMAPRSDSPGLGLGLPLMAAVTSEIEFRASRSGGTEIWMLFATSGSDAQPAWARPG